MPGLSLVPCLLRYWSYTGWYDTGTALFDASKILTFLNLALERGEGVCLVTITDVTGASVRNPGAHMAVTASGETCGSLSGGCIEKAVVAEAKKAIQAGVPHRIAYGAGTPIIDIRLPCGGRVDLLFTPFGNGNVIARLLATLADRSPAVLELPHTARDAGLLAIGNTCWDGDRFLVRHHPPLRLVIAGHGGTVEALVRQAGSLEIGCLVATPDADIVCSLEGSATPVRKLERIGDGIGYALDPWTAVAFFCHDHDWETALLAEVLESPAFYVGAMGSRTTHQQRKKLLEAVGVGQDAIARIVAPIGLIPSSRDPETLALSALAQIVDSYNAVIGAQFNPARH